MPLQHDNPEEAARAQRMTAGEAKAVIDLWQWERTEATGLTGRPAVPDVAEGLDVPVEEVQRLLAAVRARRAEEEAELARDQELAEIRLAEEERKLAENRRQRAELRRVEAHRQGQTEPLPGWSRMTPTVSEQGEQFIAQPPESKSFVLEDGELLAPEATKPESSEAAWSQSARFARALAKVLQSLLIIGFLLGAIIYVVVWFILTAVVRR